MSETLQHSLIVIDFIRTANHSIFVKFTGYDAILGEAFQGEVKFLAGVPYGDIIHSERSTLSSECRHYIRELLLEKYREGEFN